MTPSRPKAATAQRVTVTPNARSGWIGLYNVECSECQHVGTGSRADAANAARRHRAAHARGDV